VTLLANYLLNAEECDILTFAEKARVSDDFASDIGVALVHMLRTSDECFENTKNLIRRFLEPSNKKYEAAPESFDCLRKLAVTVAFRSVEAKKLKQKLDRAKYLRSLFPDGEFNCLPFFGGVAKFDFSGMIFKSCTFDHVRWGNCKFDSNTTFNNCIFTGTGSANHCTNFGLANWSGLITDSESQAFIDSLRIADGTKSYDVNDLKADMDAVLKKFFSAGGLGFKKINTNHIKTGHISASRNRDEVIEILCKKVISLVEAGASGKSYYEVSSTSKEALRFFATNNVYTGDIKTAFNELTKSLCA
jgi:hypothetical protein